jgi:hypothetical protein
VRDAPPPYRGEGPHALWHVNAAVPLDTGGDLVRFWDEAIASSLGFSGIRLRNARMHA